MKFQKQRGRGGLVTGSSLRCARYRGRGDSTPSFHPRSPSLVSPFYASYAGYVLGERGSEVQVPP